MDVLEADRLHISDMPVALSCAERLRGETSILGSAEFVSLRFISFMALDSFLCIGRVLLGFFNRTL